MFFENIGNTTVNIEIHRHDTAVNTITVEYSYDNQNWTSYSSDTNYNYYNKKPVEPGEKIYFRRAGEAETLNKYSRQYSQASAWNGFVILGSSKVSVGGNVMSLISKDNFDKKILNATEGTYTFNRLFKDCINLVSAKNLILPEVSVDCSFSSMFAGCKGLVESPNLSHIILANSCYSGMFYGCTSLTKAPELPATELKNRCYQSMFDGCTSLTETPALPAATLKDYCYYYMFQNCTSLTKVSELPATELAGNCYECMFYGCTSLSTVPEILPATELAGNCYCQMFQNCTSLTTAPVLPAATLVSSCYRNMFCGCSNLNYIKALFTTEPSTTYTQNWVSRVSSTGTFVKNAAATWDVTGVNGIPEGWTVETATE